MTDLLDISNVLTSGWTAAFRGMRNPYKSWAKSDSVFEEEQRNVVIGENDLKLASKIASAGGPHAKFRRMIHVSMDINAPIYWWKEFDTYKIGTTANSTSTMHSIIDKDFEPADFAIDPDGIILQPVIDALNSMRKEYIEAYDGSIKKCKAWRGIIQWLPESYKQLRTVDMNYETISNIVKYRKGHKLVEWEIFIRNMRDLPFADELIFCDKR